MSVQSKRQQDAALGELRRHSEVALALAWFPVASYPQQPPDEKGCKMRDKPHRSNGHGANPSPAATARY
jgi:hypothetical protein